MEREALRHEWLRDASMTSDEDSMDFDEDEVAGVGYGPVGYGMRQPVMELDQDDDDEEDDEDEEVDEGKAVSSSGVFGDEELRLQGSLAKMVVGQPRVTPTQQRAPPSSSSGSSSDAERSVFESVLNSTNEVSQGQTGLSVIDRQSSPRNTQPGSYLGDEASSFDLKPPDHDWSNDYSLHESDFSSIKSTTLGTTTSNLGMCKLNVKTMVSTPPRLTERPINSSIGSQNYNANFSPESLANPSPRPTITTNLPTINPHPTDADLPPTQPTSSFITPPLPWGRRA